MQTRTASAGLVALLWTCAGPFIAWFLTGDLHTTLIGFLLGAGIGLIGWSTDSVAGGLVIGSVGALWGSAAALLGSLFGWLQIMAVAGTATGLLAGSAIWGIGRLIDNVVAPRAGTFFLSTATGITIGATTGAIYAGVSAAPQLAAELQPYLLPDAPRIVNALALLLAGSWAAGGVFLGAIVGGAVGFVAGLLFWLLAYAFFAPR